MMSSRASLNGMGLFEGSPEGKQNPFAMFNRVQAVPGRARPARGRRRMLRARVIAGDRIQFQPEEIPQIYAEESQRFKAVGKKPLPGDFPASILPYNRAGWDFVEPHPSAQGLGADEVKDAWGAVTNIVQKASQYAPAIKEIASIFKKPKAAAPVTYAAQTYQPAPTPPTNYLPYILIGGGVLLVGGVAAILMLKR